MMSDESPEIETTIRALAHVRTLEDYRRQETQLLASYAS